MNFLARQTSRAAFRIQCSGPALAALMLILSLLVASNAFSQQRKELNHIEFNALSFNPYLNSVVDRADPVGAKGLQPQILSCIAKYISYSLLFEVRLRATLGPTAVFCLWPTGHRANVDSTN